MTLWFSLVSLVFVGFIGFRDLLTEVTIFDFFPDVHLSSFDYFDYYYILGDTTDRKKIDECVVYTSFEQNTEIKESTAYVSQGGNHKRAYSVS